MTILGFFRKHDRAMTVIGALIAAITFLVKDNLLENAKDRSDALAKAQLIMFISTNLDETNQMVRSIGRETDHLSARMDPAESSDSTRGAPRIAEENEFFQAGSDATRNALQRVKRLSADLPDSKSYTSEIETEEGMRAELVSQEASSMTSLATTYLKLPATEKLPEKWDKTVDSKFDPLISQVASIETKSNATAAKIISEAEKAKADADQADHRFTTASVFLIAVAGSLSLIGKLAGNNPGAD